MQAIKGVVFDKDGTLFDFQATWGAWAKALVLAEAEGDPELAAALAEALGVEMTLGQIRPGSVVIAQTTEEVAEAILPLLPNTSKSLLMSRMDAASASLPQMQAAPLGPLMAGLRARGLRLGLATNDSEAPARAHLKAAGIAADFDFVAGFDSGWGGKPAPGQLLAFARATGLDPADCAMVGDSLHDLHAARAAGMLAVGVLTGLADRATLARAADVVLGSVADLPGWLDGGGSSPRPGPA